MKFPVSFSRLVKMEQCPAQFEALYITKVVQDTGSEASRHGDVVHKALQVAVDTGMSPSVFPEAVQPLIAWKQQPGVVVRTEQQLAVDENLKPTDWFSKTAWFRAIIDVNVVDSTRNMALQLDWKTGKIKSEATQLAIFSLFGFIYYPEVERIKSAYVWLGHGQVTDMMMHRRDAAVAWDALSPRLERYQGHIDSGDFPTRPSGLCPWCPKKHLCPDARV